MPNKPTLVEKLESLGIHPASVMSSIQKPSAHNLSIESILDGKYIKTQQGETFLREQFYDSEYQNGKMSTAIDTPLRILSEWANDSRLSELPFENFAFLDTETSGLAGGTGTYAFMVGVARFDGKSYHLAQFFMDDPSAEAALLEALANFLTNCKAIVTFNGKTFDIPLLSTRYRLHSMPIPYEGYSHIDLLPIARRLWRDRLPSRGLKYIEENVLGVQRSSEEVPGYEIPYLYFDFLRTGNPNPLKSIFYHNAMDVITMSSLLNYITSILENPLSDMLTHGLDCVALGKLYEDIGRWDTAARLYEKGLELVLPEDEFWQAIKRLSHLQKRRGDLETAMSLWMQAAEVGHIYAHVELAKYFEHILKDHLLAYEWTAKAIGKLAEKDLPEYIKNHWLEELNHRSQRLSDKLQRKRKKK